MVYVKWEKPKRFYKMIDKYTIEFWSKSGEIYGKRETGGGDYEVGYVLGIFWRKSATLNRHSMKYTVWIFQLS